MSQNDYLVVFAEGHRPLMETVKPQTPPFMEIVKPDLETDVAKTAH